MLAAAEGQLARWGIAVPTARAAGLFDTEDASRLLPGLPPRPAIVIPYYAPGGAILQVGGRPFARFRWLDNPTQAGGFVRAKPVRYGQPQHTGVQVYLPPMLEWARILADPAVPIIITEGEAKAITAVANGFTCLALGGVYNFTGAGGELVELLEQVQWQGRQVIVVFDSDAATNPDVLAAEARLIEELQTKRGAKCRIVRLPPDGEEKVGLDDFLHAHGADQFERLVASSADLSGLDAKIVALNKTCAWVEQESAVFDRTTGLFIQKHAFVIGSGYGAIKHITVGGPKSAPKVVSVAERWLTHPHAQRFAEVLFRPGEPDVLVGEHGRALNLWKGWQEEPGSVEPWLKLDAYLFHRLPEPLRDVPRKTMIYKAQNPKSKIPMALVLLGVEGSGKGLWADSVRGAFAPYSRNVKPNELVGEYQNFLEKSVVATIHEMDPETMRKGSETLKALITDLKRPMNEKYRAVREIESYTFYILTSNLHGVGSYSGTDRRMFVIPCPPPGSKELYDEVLRWQAGGGARHLMNWMLTYDLKGWRPPERAPMTTEKYMAFRENLTPVQLLAEEMATAKSHVVVQWLNAAWAWADVEELGANSTSAARARAIKQAMGQFQIRPWYSPEELTLMHPAVLSNVYGLKIGQTTPGQLSRQLRDAGVPYLVNRNDPRGFFQSGQVRQYLVVADREEWADPAGITQTDFDRLMRGWPTYRAVRER